MVKEEDETKKVLAVDCCGLKLHAYSLVKHRNKVALKTIVGVSVAVSGILLLIKAFLAHKPYKLEPFQARSHSNHLISSNSGEINKVDKPGSNHLIFYPECSSWEFDYVIIDLLAEISSHSLWRYYRYKSLTDLLDLAATNNAVGSNDNKKHLILIFNHASLSLREAKEFVEEFHPQILIQLSDENGEGKDYLEVLAPKVSLMLREYSHVHYPSLPYAYQIPLGYMTGMLGGTPSIDRKDVNPMSQRKLQWSFIGSLKQDRSIMLDTFSQALPGSYFVSHNSSAPATFKYYNDAVFVPNGRGWSTLDCLRLYEASLAGAIPVVVGNDHEISITFYYNGNQPPWIFATDWVSAAKRCKALLEGPNELLQSMQEENLAWWKLQILLTRNRVHEALS